MLPFAATATSARFHEPFSQIIAIEQQTFDSDLPMCIMIESMHTHGSHDRLFKHCQCRTAPRQQQGRHDDVLYVSPQGD